jgi:hypothetical protein
MSYKIVLQAKQQKYLLIVFLRIFFFACSKDENSFVFFWMMV